MRMDNHFLDSFVNRVEKQHLPVDGVMVYKGEDLMAEHRWSPDVPTCIYSHTKSFMSTAAGIAIDRGLLSLDSYLVDSLKEDLPKQYDARIEKIQLRHLLTMSSGFGCSLLMMGSFDQPDFKEDYIDFMMRQPMKYNPGEKFWYSNGDSYLAGLMVARAAQVNLLDFMMDTFMNALEIPRPQWWTDPRGNYFGASRMMLRTRDMAQLGILYLNKGVYRGQRLLSESWVDQVSTLQIETEHGNRFDCGYTYQFWLDPMPGCYRADGAFGQITHILPDKGCVVSYNCHANDVLPIQEAFYDEIYMHL